MPVYLLLVIMINAFYPDVTQAVLQRFSCTEYGRSTQTCKMTCNYDGSCTERLRIVSCNCDGYGEETFQENFWQNGEEVNYLKHRKLPFSPYVKKRGFGGYTTACDNLPTRCSSCTGGAKSGGSATKWQTDFCDVYEDEEFLGRLH